MKLIPIALDAHYKSRSTSLAMLWKIIRQDGLVFAFTDHDVPIPFEGTLYETTSGFSPSAIAAKADMSVDNLDVLGVLADGGIEAEDIEAGRWDKARVELRRINWRRPQDGAEKVRWGTLGNIQRKRGQYVAELRGLMQALQVQIGELIQAPCRANLGDELCKVDLDELREIGTVTAASSRRLFEASGLSGPSGWYNLGDVRFLSGLNAGIAIEVRDYIAAGGGSDSDGGAGSSDGASDGPPGSIELQLLLPYLPTIGDTFEIVPGCDKSKAMCIDRYDNILNNRGFSFVPGQDAALQIGGQ